MDKESTLNYFWNQFGCKAYDSNTVPDDAPYPRITYEVITDNIGVQNVLTASIWDRSTSWKKVTDIQHAIEARIGLGGQSLHCSGGLVWICRGVPFAQRMSDPDDQIRHIVVNIEVEFITEV